MKLAIALLALATTTLAEEPTVIYTDGDFDELAPDEDEGGERREKPPDDADALLRGIESRLEKLRGLVGAADGMDDEDEDED